MAAAAWARVGVRVPYERDLEHPRRLLPRLLERRPGNTSGIFQGRAHRTAVTSMRGHANRGVGGVSGSLSLESGLRQVIVKLLIADSNNLQNSEQVPVCLFTKVAVALPVNIDALALRINIVKTCSRPSPEVPDLNEIVRHVAPCVTVAPISDATALRTTHP